MKLSQLTTTPFETIYAPEEDCTIETAYTSDLLSDVMGNAPEESVLITIQAHKNTVAVATLAGVHAIILCHQRPVPKDMIAAAKQESIAILRTKENQFETSWRIKQLLDT